MKAIEYVKRPLNIIKFAKNHSLLDALPDLLYLKLVYREKMGEKLNLSTPKTFNEKIQWLKLYDRKSIYTDMVDKYETKKYVASVIGNKYVIPTLGIWDSFEDIDFTTLPNQFVLKCTHDSGGLSICRDKSSFDISTACMKIERSMETNYYMLGREWPYKNVKRRILAETYMESVDSRSLIDYKFYCFNGEPKFLYISIGLENHTTAQMSFLNLDWRRAQFQRNDYEQFKNLPDKPKHYDEMIEIAKKLSKGITFLRVDLYEINDKVYFSELTFSPCGGMMPFEPKEYDRIVGDMLILPSEKR